MGIGIKNIILKKGFLNKTNLMKGRSLARNNSYFAGLGELVEVGALEKI